ncbi:Protein of unknown function [Pseudomonas peli]|uniref:DUF2939 domain-containing protein n=2 Tax=Pseudomonas peli TaxID=592361 RepID=A0AB37Z5C6_9PSED|nr:Protein of unknown function [Pseudomonas peli]
MQCPKCLHEAAQEDFGQPLCCPKCGVFYAKALAAKQRRENPAPVDPAPIPGPRKGGHMKLVAALGAFLFAGYVIAAPYITVYQIRQAAKASDADALEQHIDFPSVRESLKAQMNAHVMESAKTELADNPFAAFGVAFASALVDRMVTAFVTPAGLAEMMKGKKPAMAGSAGEEKGSASDTHEREPFEGADMGYQGPNRFVVTVTNAKGGDPARFILKRSGISWQLSDVKLPM